ncbi:MAG: DMT family transporter [Armatimonadota bacterium]
MTGPGTIYALGAALLFGASTPFAKLLGENVHPVVLAGLLYLGAGAGLGVWLLLRPSCLSEEASLRRRDFPYLAGAILLGGAAGPALLMTGLQQMSASTASLLLNLEGVFTVAVARLLFREHVPFRILAGMLLIVAGGVALSWTGRPDGSTLTGPLLVMGACVCWALDNNLTRCVSASDPAQIAALKGWVAGTANVGLGLWAGGSLPSLPLGLQVALVGTLGYGVSLAMFIASLREIGAARAGGYFSTAPFVGAFLSVVLLRDTIHVTLVLAATLMAAGVWLHLTEWHHHEHHHDETTHEHRHTHFDLHHDHPHPYPWDPARPHSHEHFHQPLRHTHAHFPDIHHRHLHNV